MRVLTFISVVLLMAASASAVPTWALDFEDGFTATSGTPNINKGDLLDPGNTAADPNNEIHCETDPLNTSNTALDVENNILTLAPKSYLAYTGMPAALSMSGQGVIKSREYFADNTNNRKYSLWTLTPGTPAVYDKSMVYLYVRRASSAWSTTVWSYSNYEPGVSGYYDSHGFTTPPMVYPWVGWHDWEFTWKYLGILESSGEGEGGEDIHSAFISVALDGICMGTATIDWPVFDIGMFVVGSNFRGEWDGDVQKSSSKQIDGLELGDLVDDYVIITPEPATALLLLSGCVFFRKRK